MDVGECVHTCDDFLAELGRGAFGVVYLTKPTKEQPSVVLKVCRLRSDTRPRTSTST